MIVHNVPVEVDRSAGLLETSFAMDPTAEAFDILSSGLYSDKPKAVIRELACNAHDSHVAAGCPTRPIEIHLPSALDLTFYVKDYGTGLTDYEVRGGWLNEQTGEQVSDLDATMTPEEYIAMGFVRSTGIFNTFFRSTKTRSNDFIGQLGLGSKSPFSYAATFNVEVRKDGQIRTYTCYKNEEGKPVITLMAVQDTTEENGVTVSMAVRRDDVEKFNSAARSALMYFTPTPDVRGVYGFKPYDMIHTVKGESWRVRQAEYYAFMEGPYVVQGFVAYPVDTELLIEGGLTGAAAQVAKTNIDLYVPIGAARPAASREALQYDRRTVVNLITSLNQAADEMRKSFQDEFDKCETEYEAAVLCDKFSNTGGDTFKKLFAAMHAEREFMWRGQPVRPTIKLDLTDCGNITILRVKKSGRNKKTLNKFGEWVPEGDLTKVYELPVQCNTHFIFSDKPTGISGQLREYVNGLPDVDGRAAQLFVVKAREKRLLSAAEASRDSIENQLSVTFTPIASLPPATSQRRTGSQPTGTSSSKRDKSVRYVWNGFLYSENYWGRKTIRRKYSRSCWAKAQVDLAAGGLYIPIDGFYASTPTRVGMYIDDFLQMAVDEKLIPSTAVVGMSARDLSDAKKAGGKWVNVFEHLTAEFQKINDAGKLTGRKTIAAVNSGTTKKMDDLFKAYRNAKFVELGDNKLRSFFEQYADIHDNASELTPEKVEKIANFANLKLDDTGRANELIQLWKEVQTTYPMLSMLPWDTLSIDDKTITKLVEYMTLVDAVDKEVKTEDSAPQHEGTKQ